MICTGIAAHVGALHPAASAGTVCALGSTALFSATIALCTWYSPSRMRCASMLERSRSASSAFSQLGTASMVASAMWNMSFMRACRVEGSRSTGCSRKHSSGGAACGVAASHCCPASSQRSLVVSYCLSFVHLGGLQRLDLLALDGGAVHAVLAVQELDDIAHRIAHRAVIPDQVSMHGTSWTGTLLVSIDCCQLKAFDKVLCWTVG